MDPRQELQTDDVVALSTDESMLAVVERTHSDIDTHDPYPGRSEPDKIRHDRSISKFAFSNFMKHGIPPKDTVLIRWQHTTHPSLIPVSKLVLVDRSLVMGDVVKKNPRDAMSGVVINTFTKCTLQPMCYLSLVQNSREVLSLKGLLPPSDDLDYNIRQDKPAPLVDIPASELKYVESITEDEMVIYKDWIGRVDTMTTCISVRLSDNCVVEISDDDADHVDGAGDMALVGDVVSTKKGVLRNGKWVYGRYNPNTMPVGTVVQTRNVGIDIQWLQRRIGSNENTQEPPVPLERDEFESSHFHVYDKTAKPKTNAAQSNTISNSEIDVRLGLRVRFKDLAGACVKYDGSSEQGKLHRIDRKDTLGYDLNVFDVIKFRTEVFVQWQDLSITREQSINLIPDQGIDDLHSAWPGEIAHTLKYLSSPDLPGTVWPEKVGVIQDVNAAERMATIRWCPGASLHYSEDEDHPEVKTLLTGVVGFPGTEQEEVSLYDIEAPSAMNVRRGDSVLISFKRWKEGGVIVDGDEGVDWFGDIVDTNLDGTLTVRLGAAKEVRDVVLRREDLVVAVRSDGTDEVDAWGNDTAMADGSDSDTSSDSSDEDATGSEGETQEMDVKYEDENGMPLEQSDVENDQWESDDGEGADGDIDMIDAPPDSQTPPTSHSATPPSQIDKTKTPPQPAEPTNESSAATSALEPYLILEGDAPDSHEFSVEPGPSNPTQIKRIQKEHKILRTADNLPKGVYVRTWENRLDILRVLFIGPADTPYANAPFVIDFYLSSQFPTRPPDVYFHSWSLESGLGGVGRVNPNLYEDGKICLSLLGTWEGQKGEGWEASRSTILQVLVSILGLVLVKEPYFNEAGYETLAGLESSRRPSALYSERAYLRSMTFVIKALTWLKSEQGGTGTTIEGLQDILRKTYKEDGLLAQLIKDVDTVLEGSESGTLAPDGLTVISKGACIPLKRIREQLLTL